MGAFSSRSRRDIAREMSISPPQPAAHRPLGERHLRAVVREFVEHSHAERNHQGLGNVIPFPSRDSAPSVGRIGRRERLGGVLSFYERNAA
jgi:hypothetical protein